MSKDNEFEVALDFFKYMDDTIKREDAKKNTVLPSTTNNKEVFNPNREYQNRYSHRVNDRMWIGPRRY
jgi:hypothetical protein